MSLSDPIFHDDEAARKHLEALRWPNGPYCPRCGEAEAITRLQGKSTAPGLCICKSCRTKFSVTMGTVFERSHIPLSKWMLGFRLMASSKKGISAHQLHRSLDITYKSAWFMAHRIREAMALPPEGAAPMGGEGKVIEADATYIGGKEKNKHRSKRDPKKIGGAGKQIAHVLVERGGEARSHHVANVTGKTLRPIIVKHASRKSALMTDEHGGYYHVGKEFARHETVDHGKDEYVRGDAYSNTAESYFAILKRGVYGTFHHVSEAHLHRYLAEFDFRWTNRAARGVDDRERANEAVRGATGKRLTYRRIGEGANA
ncbi:MAG TPA: IS1595 family transposase [Caulobacteraceae bacterium]|nr:IS1595 family transposase [Caulobacteraceae bacterium]